jgi:hypothetical protein
MRDDHERRIALLEKVSEEIPAIKEDVAALKRFQVSVMTVMAALGATATFFADSIRKKLGL